MKLEHNIDTYFQIVAPFSPYPSGTLSSILTSVKPIAIIIPGNSGHLDYFESVALRIAHNLYTYLKLDCTIHFDHEASTSNLDGRSVVVIGGYHNKYGVSVRTSPLQVSPDGAISIVGMRYSEPGTAALSLHKVRAHTSPF